MFKNLTYKCKVRDNSYTFDCKVEDSNFVKNLTVLKNFNTLNKNTVSIEAIVLTYRYINSDNIAKILAKLYYKDAVIRGSKVIESLIYEWLEIDRDIIDKYNQKLEYGERYYGCVLNNFKMLGYGKIK